VAEARGASHAGLSGRSAPALYPLPVDRLFPSGWMIDLWIGTVLATLVAGANAATQGHNVFARRYHRLRRRKIANVAKTAVARSLARCVYGVLKSGGNYQEARWGRRPTGVVTSWRAGKPEVAIGP